MLYIFVALETLVMMASPSHDAIVDQEIIATVDWLLKFPTTRAHHLEAFHLNHKPLLLASNSESRRFNRKGRPFKFEAMWLKDKSCETMIKTSWKTPLGSSPVANLSKKIDLCQINL